MLCLGVVVAVHTINRQRRSLAHLIKPAAHTVARNNGHRLHDHIAVKDHTQRLPVIHLQNLSTTQAKPAVVDREFPAMLTGKRHAQA